MEEEKFDNATLDIVKLALKKASNGGIEFLNKYRFTTAHIEYLLKGDESPLGDNAQRRLIAYGIECTEPLFKVYIAKCREKNKTPTHPQLVNTQLFLAFTKHLMDQGHKDIGFQWRVYGKFDTKQKLGVDHFASPSLVVRMIKNKKEKGLLFNRDTYIPDDISDELKMLLRVNETIFIINCPERNFFLHLSLDELLSFCVDYM